MLNPAMSNLNWCTYCDNAVSAFSNSLYCSEACLRADALHHHPLLGYDYAELKDFPRSSHLSTSSSSLSSVTLPRLSPVLSFTLPSSQQKPLGYTYLSPPSLHITPQNSPASKCPVFHF
ncbi:hypothetical protein BDF14DRAFT_1782805 [Spinellus fusiger]|nr:hypothetical protein BDF14DRAFT_1782805 [Spinellus fusiger]